MRRIAVVAFAIPVLASMSCSGGGGGGGYTPPPPPSGPEAPQPLQKIYTEHLGKLDDTTLNPLADVGLIGHDLGISFERDGELVFLFGDSMAINSAYTNGDSVAWADPSLNPLTVGAMPKLTWFLESPGQFLPVRIPGVDLGPMNTPVEGVPIGSKTYLFAVTGWNDATSTYSGSALARTDGLALDSLTLVGSVTPSNKFLNVSVVEDDDTLWIFGSGTYRKSAVYLAKVASSQIAEHSAWSYFQGYQQGTAVFGPYESSATPVVPASCVGELSVRHHEGLGYLMAFNCDSPRGIHLRFADQPTGPWSASMIVFHPTSDLGYGYFIHQGESYVGYDDGLSDPELEDYWGGEYGPYLVPQWMTVESPGVYSIVYTLSSWNPYRSHLMRTIVAEPGVSASPPPPAGTGLPRATLVNGDFAAENLNGWQTSGEPFAVYQGSDGRWRLTTNVPSEGGTAVQGEAWQDFVVDAKTHELRFSVSGGDAADTRVSVKLLLLGTGNEVVATVRASRGTGSDSQQRTVHWLLDDLHGKKVRLLIEDHSIDTWGYVTTTGFTLVQSP